MKKERIHVLVVEDEDAHAELIRRAFEPQSDVIRLSVAKNLREARASLTESLPDLAIVDLFLPDGRGLELLEGDEAGPNYPVVIVTSHGDEQAAVEAMKAGALQYVVKSEVALAELPHKVDSALRQWGHIVERKQAETALQSSEEHFRSLIENALDIITAVDEEGRIRYVSPSFGRLLGYSTEMLAGRSVLELVHPDDQKSVARMVEGAFTEPLTKKIIYRHRHADGTWHELEAVGSSYRHSTDGERGVINARDITDRRQTQREKQELEGRLRQSQNWEAVANLAGKIAREFNEKLTRVIEQSTMALQETTEGSKARAGLEKALAASHDARRLAEQIFLFSRRSEPRVTALRLQDIVAGELDDLRSSLPTNVRLDRELDASCPPVVADPEQIQGILRNLFSNAIYAMRKKGGLLEVRLEETTNGLEERQIARLTVRDTGDGMDQETLRHALEAFFTTKTPDKAAGLGLSVAHAIVASQGGDLVVSSEPGEGTTIRVELPCTS